MFFYVFVGGFLLYFGIGFFRVVDTIFFCAWIMLSRSLYFCCFAAAGFRVVRVVYRNELAGCFVCFFDVVDMIVTLTIVCHMYFSHASMNTCISCPHARGCTPHAPCTCIRTYSYPCTCPLP